MTGSDLRVLRSVSRLLPRPELASDAHKGDAGRVLVVAGSAAMPGAAILSVRAAQRAGAGLVALACLDAELAVTVPVAAPEAVLVRAFAAGLADWLDERDDHATLVGPGMGNTKRTRAAVDALLDRPGPLVIDADGLNVLAGELDRLAGAAAELVLTPHPGEAARLLERAIPTDPSGRLDAALELSRRARAVVCLKGAGTVVAEEPSGLAFVDPTANPALATAGSGDVLAGALLACLADTVATRGDWTAFDAAAYAVAVHAAAGVLAAERTGVRGAIASDLIELLPAAERRLEPWGEAR